MTLDDHDCGDPSDDSGARDDPRELGLPDPELDQFVPRSSRPDNRL
jgi:hypothetical protein